MEHERGMTGGFYHLFFSIADIFLDGWSGWPFFHSTRLYTCCPCAQWLTPIFPINVRNQGLTNFVFRYPPIDSTVLIYAFLPTWFHLWRHRSVCDGEVVHGALEGGTCHRRNSWDIRLLAGLLHCLCYGDEFMTLLLFERTVC
jgi:hypothetical protein